MKAWQIIFIILLSLAVLSFFVHFFNVRNNLIRLQEKVKKCKSDLRVAKSRYLQVLSLIKKTNKDVNREASLDDKYFSSIIGQPMQYKNLAISAATVTSLAKNYEDAQRDLNNAVNYFNVYRRKIHVLYVALILGYKKEKYIDEDKLELINTQGYDENEI